MPIDFASIGPHSCLGMIFSENRFTLFRIMPQDNSGDQAGSEA